jgi:hypothetical protein
MRRSIVVALPRIAAFRRAALSAALGAFVASVSGCATLHNGTHESVRLNSDPPGAEAVIDGTEHVTTPAQVELERGKDHSIAFHKGGFEDADTSITSGESGWVWGNILIGGIPGIIADEIDGAAKKLSTEDVETTLTPIAAEAPPSQGSAAAVFSSDQPAPHQAATTIQPPRSNPNVTGPQPVLSVPQTKSE